MKYFIINTIDRKKKKMLHYWRRWEKGQVMSCNINSRLFILLIALIFSGDFNATFAGVTSNEVEIEGVGVSFSLEFAAIGKKSEPVRISAADMCERQVERVSGGWNITWRSHPVIGEEFAVVAKLKSVQNGWDWAMDISGNGTSLGLTKVQFPVLSVQRADDAAVLVPQGVGMIHRPDWNKLVAGALIASSPCWAFHFVALLNGETEESWYCDQRGEAWRYPASFEVCNGAAPGRAAIGFSLTPEYTPNLKLPFQGAIRRFRGNWYEAASIYREWVRKTPRVKELFKRDRARLREIAIWFWNRGPEEDAVLPVERWISETGITPALDWYWWHKIPYDVGYPFFWPPREGEERFSSAVKRLEGKGALVQPYINGVAWDVDDSSWQGVAGEVCTFIDGGFPATKYNNFTDNRLTVMCSSSKSFRAEISALASKLRKAGISALYLDQIGGCTDHACYNCKHPHIPGGGTAMKDGYRSMLAQVRRENPGLFLATEDPSEAYLDSVDAFISLWPVQERFNLPPEPAAKAVPVFQMLFHELVTVFGSYAVPDGIPPWDPKWPEDGKWQKERNWNAIYPDQFALEFARGVAFGQQPTVHQLRNRHFTDPDSAGNFRFIVETARFYRDNREYLFDGTMLNPGKLECAAPETKLFIRGIYTKPSEAREIVTRSPAILHGIWKSPEGKIAAILCNWTREEQAYSLATPDIIRKGVIPARSWIKIEFSRKEK